MANPWKVYQNKEHLASTKYAEDAALLVANTHEGIVVFSEYGYRTTVWREGHEKFSAGESCDGAAQFMRSRANAYSDAKTARDEAADKKFWDDMQAATERGRVGEIDTRD